MQLSDSNIKLREELDQTRNTTRRLNEEVLRLSGELSATRQRLDAKEKEWEERLKVRTYVHTYVCASCVRTCSTCILYMYIDCCTVYTLHCICVYVRTYVHMYAHVPLWATLYIEPLQISPSTTHCLHVCTLMLTSVVLKALPCCYVPGHVTSPRLSHTPSSVDHHSYHGAVHKSAGRGPGGSG